MKWKLHDTILIGIVMAILCFGTIGVVYLFEYDNMINMPLELTSNSTHLCQFDNVTLVEERVVAVWFTGDKCSLLCNDHPCEFEGVKVKR